MVGWHAVAAQQGKSSNLIGQLGLLAIDGYRRNAARRLWPRGTRKRRANGSPAAARRSLSGRGRSRMPGLKKPGARRAAFVAVAGVSGVKSR